MKDRLITVGGGLLAFAMVVVLLVPVDEDESRGVSRPLSTDRGADGLQVMRRWLERGGVSTMALGRRYTALASDLELSPVGNLLVISLPQHTPSRTKERTSLNRWLAQGNSALVLIAAGNVPLWAIHAESRSIGRALESLGFELDRRAEDESGASDERQQEAEEDRSEESWLARAQEGFTGEAIALVPRSAHPLTAGVSGVASRSMPELDSGWFLTGAADGRVVLPLLVAPDGGGALWEARVGTGRIWLSRYSDLFANGTLDKADNARLLANLVRSSLGPNGAVIFDDMHLGATDLYDARAFFADPRFINTLVFLVGFWLLYLVGRSRRLAPAREPASRYYAADLARAMAGFFVRRLSPATVERQMFAFFFDDIRSRYGLPTNGQPVWSILSGSSRVSTADLGELRARYERTAARRPDLLSLARLLRRTRKSLL